MNGLPNANASVSKEYLDALFDFQAIGREYGNTVTIRLRHEADVVRDVYGGVKARASGDPFTVNAMTIDYQPSRKRLEKNGLRLDCDASIVVAMQDFIDRGTSFDDIDIERTTVNISRLPSETNGTDYIVTEKARTNEYGNGYLGITLGLRRL